MTFDDSAPRSIDNASHEGGGTQFRAAVAGFLMAFDEGGLSLPVWNRFPTGACDHASEMLAEYLLACRFGDWACAVRSPAHGQGHTWLERGDWIVDITADQFSGRASYGRVAPAIATRDRTWHERHFPHSRRQMRLGVGVMFGAVLDRARADYTILRFRTDSFRERWPATHDPSACQP